MDLQARIVERHTEPSRDVYRLIRRTRRGKTLASEALPEASVPVDAVPG